jgi:hypothetical protein
MQTFTGTEYLQMDIAANFGDAVGYPTALDKCTWNQRLQWFKDNEDMLEDLIHQADEPALYFAGVQAYRATQQGKRTGYPISLDATSSGLQLLSVLTGDRKAAALCNVINKEDADGSPIRMDAYTAIYEAMLRVIGEVAKIDRKHTKNAIMTALYTSKAEPKRVFGEGPLLTAFYDTMAEELPGAWELNEAMPSLWNPGAREHSWILPDNFHVHVKVMTQVKETVNFLNAPFEVFHYVNEPTEQGRSLGANTTHSLDGMVVREISRRCNYDMKVYLRCLSLLDLPAEEVTEEDEDYRMVSILWQRYKESGYLSARIIDHLNPQNISLVRRKDIHDLLMSMPEKPFQVISIHDCFRVLPNYGNDLRKQYNLQLELIAKSNILDYLISQLLGKPVQLNKIDPDLWKDIAKTEYALS